MEPKIIIIPFAGRDHELAALETGLDLAKKWEAHAAVWHVLPDPEEMITSIAAFGVGAPYLPDESTFAELMKLNNKSKKEAQSKFLKAIKKMNIPHEDAADAKGASASLNITIGHADKVIGIRGRLADLIVMSRSPDANALYSDAVTAALFQTGRPVLLVPPGESAKPLNGNTVIAWNGSPEAIHAISAALPFLEKGKVWTLTGENDNWDMSPILPQQLVAYLKLHGIHAEALTPWINHTPLPEVILASAKKLDAGLIVMGAFGHSRMREMVMGGVTAHMLKEANIPILMAH